MKISRRECLDGKTRKTEGGSETGKVLRLSLSPKSEGCEGDTIKAGNGKSGTAGNQQEKETGGGGKGG